jgi:hypothetical protein
MRQSRRGIRRRLIAGSTGVASLVRRIEYLGQPEIEDLHRSVRSDFDIRRLEVPMDDAFLVRRLERFGDLSGDRQSLFERKRSARDPVRQVVALDNLHDQRKCFTSTGRR